MRSPTATREAGHRAAFHPARRDLRRDAGRGRTPRGRLDPSLIGICLDVGHYLVGGGDPVAALRDLGERVTHVHLKDVDPRCSGAFARASRRLRRGGPGAHLHRARRRDARPRRGHRRPRPAGLRRLADGRAGQLLGPAVRERRDRAPGPDRGPAPGGIGAGRRGGLAMRIALLGAGRIGRLHARLLSATPGVERLIVADADPARAADVAAAVGATAAATIDAALDEADGVVIAAATEAHAELTRTAIARGLPTFCEKPLAVDLPDTIAVADEIERSGVPFQLGFQRRFDPGYAEARRLIVSGELGHALLGLPRRPRPGTAARGVHPRLRRAVPRLLHPRLRRPALDDRLRGRTRSMPMAASGASRCSPSTTTSTPASRPCGWSTARSSS